MEKITYQILIDHCIKFANLTFSENNEVVTKQIMDFLKRKAVISIRDNKINSLINESINDSKFDLDEPLFGSTFQSSYRKVYDLKSTSHSISSILIENGKFYGIVTILNTPQGKSLELLDNIEENLILKVIYSDLGIINTFDLDFKQTKVSA